MSTILVLRDIVKTFPGAVPLNGFSLSVDAGEIVALVGKSGSGKTTALRAIMGFEDIDRGSIKYCERELSRPGRIVPPEKRGIGMVFQDFALFPHMTVAKNVGYGLPSGAPIDRVLEMVGLSGLERRYPHELSGGQQQRVAVARALAPEPSLVLLDEPFNNLDGALKAGLLSELRRIIRGTGAAAVVVTHDPEDALALADRIAVLSDGRIVQCDSPEVVYSTPASAEIARFFGPVNVVPAAWFPGPPTPEGSALVRPGDVVVEPGDPENATMIVEDAQFRGDYLEVWITDRPTGQEIVAHCRLDTGFRAGDSVEVKFGRSVARRRNSA